MIDAVAAISFPLGSVRRISRIAWSRLEIGTRRSPHRVIFLLAFAANRLPLAPDLTESLDGVRCDVRDQSAAEGEFTDPRQGSFPTP